MNRELSGIFNKGAISRCRKFFQSALTVIFLVMAAFIVVMQSPLNYWSNNPSGTDSSVFKYVALVMSKGGMPYKDAFDHKGPLIYIINYLGQIISYYRGVWVMEFLSMLIYIVAIYRIARLFSGRMFSCLAIATTIVPLFDYFHQGNFTEEYAMPFIAVSLYFFCDYFFNDKINKVRLLICGVCFAAVFLLRANMISVWIVFCIAVLIWYYKKNENIPWHFLIWFLIGAAILTVPILIWLIQGDAFGYFINDYFGFNQKYCAAGNNLFIYDIYNTLAYFIFSNVMLISVVALLYLTKKDRNSFFNIIYWGYIILTLLMISMAGRAYDHYGMILCPMFIYPLCQLENYFCRKESTQNIVVMYALVLVLISAPDWKANMDAAVKAMSAPNESMNISGDVQNILQIVSENTEDDEKIIVIGNSNFYYLASERLAASRYSYQTPIAFVDEEIKEEFVNDLKEQMPRIVIVPDYQSSSQMDIFETREDYELIYITDDNTGVYVRKD